MEKEEETVENLEQSRSTCTRISLGERQLSMTVTCVERVESLAIHWIPVTSATFVPAKTDVIPEMMIFPK